MVVEALREFQSSSGPKTGCNERANAARQALMEFQSSSGPKTGCNRRPG